MNKDLDSKFSWKEMIPSIIYGLLIILQLFMVYFYYNFYNITLLIWIGWLLLILFFMIGSLPRIAFKKSEALEKGKHFLSTTKLVDTGIYSIVRHPYWLSWILFSLSLSLLGQYWPIVLFGIISCTLIYLETFHLDKRLIKKFGENYMIYKKRVPRMNLVIGLIKKFIKRDK